MRRTPVTSAPRAPLVGAALTLALGCTLATAGCAHERRGSSSTSASEEVQTQVVDRYISLYAARDDLDAFTSLFREDAVLEDHVLRRRVQGPAAIAEFYYWDAPGFALVDPSGPVMRVDRRSSASGTVTLQGEFTPFRYHGRSHGPMDFVIILQLDERGQIVRQDDWIAYPLSLVCPGADS